MSTIRNHQRQMSGDAEDSLTSTSLRVCINSHVVDGSEALNLPEAVCYMVPKFRTKDLHSRFGNFDILCCSACGIFLLLNVPPCEEEVLRSAFKHRRLKLANPVTVSRSFPLLSRESPLTSPLRFGDPDCGSRV